MRATISLRNGTKIEVDCTLEELMRLAGEPGYSIFIPICSCGTAWPCGQHPTRTTGVRPTIATQTA